MIGRIVKIVCLAGLFVIVAAVSAYFALSLLVRSEDTVILPDFTGKEVVSVLEYLTELGLNTKVKGSQYSAEIPKHHVIYQEPEPGTEIKKGRDVKIVISKGTEIILMPNLIGLDLRKARIIFEENDLCRGNLSRTYYATLAKDEIIAQVPSAGQAVHRGACIDILISLGQRPRTYIMPNLEGLPLEDALLMIEKQRLVHGNIRTQFIEDAPRNTVIAQEPLPGYRVAEKSAVDLIVNRKRPESDSDVAPGGRLFQYRVESGFLKRHIRVQFKHNGFTSELYNDFVKPGTGIWLIIPTDGEATLLVYVDDHLVETRVYEAR
jgi:serine/threonine-protein kinase